MHVLRLAAVTSLAVALPLASISAQSTASEPAKWSFSLGVDPTHFNLHPPEPGVDARMVANLTRSWQSRNSRFARNISLMVGMDAPRQVTPSIDPLCACAMRISRDYAGLTAGASYDLFSLSRFTPYLKGGTGVYYNKFGRGPADGMLTPAELLLYQNGGFGQSSFSLGVNGGVGMKVRIGSHELFIEQALHAFDVNNLGTNIYPLNIGLRF